MPNIYARVVQDSLPMRKICATFVQDCTYFTNAQYMRKLYFFLQCAIYVQDLHKIVLISPMCNICERFAQDCTYFPNAQYMRKICARLYLFLQCAIYDLFLQCAIYAQDLRKIVLISPMHNICANCTSFFNAQYMRKICARLYFFPQCAIYAQDLHKIVLISSMCNIRARLYLFLQCAIYVQDCTSFSNTQYMHKIVLNF